MSIVISSRNRKTQVMRMSAVGYREHTKVPDVYLCVEKQPQSLVELSNDISAELEALRSKLGLGKDEANG
jgi:hypothetical protein